MHCFARQQHGKTQPINTYLLSLLRGWGWGRRVCRKGLKAHSPSVAVKALLQEQAGDLCLSHWALTTTAVLGFASPHLVRLAHTLHVYKDLCVCMCVCDMRVQLYVYIETCMMRYGWSFNDEDIKRPRHLVNCSLVVVFRALIVLYGVAVKTSLMYGCLLFIHLLFFYWLCAVTGHDARLNMSNPLRTCTDVDAYHLIHHDRHRLDDNRKFVRANT